MSSLIVPFRHSRQFPVLHLDAQRVAGPHLLHAAHQRARVLPTHDGVATLQGGQGTEGQHLGLRPLQRGPRVALPHGVELAPAVEGARDAVKAEACDDCGSYLKIVNMEKDPHVEPVADDIATLALDVMMYESGKPRSGPNLMLFTAGWV